MLRYSNYQIVFQEVPGEVSLAINITGCPNKCKGCHSPHLMEDTGEILNADVLNRLLNKHGNAITCICFMGGDSHPEEIESLSVFIKEASGYCIKTAWYSGRSQLPRDSMVNKFDFIKLGPYVEKFGALDAPETNQRFYKIENGKMVDITFLFQKISHLIPI
jgi:anaerobic ribonucleoside-triphosphate reductase activating protein